MPPTAPPQRRGVPAPTAPSALRWVLAVALLVLAAGPLAGTAAAHATLVASTPGNDEVVASAPSEVRLTFDEAVSPAAGAVRVIDPDGAQVQRGGARERRSGLEVVQRVADGGAGTYTVSYRVLSADGHVIEGSFVYHVERRTGAAEVDDTGGPADALAALGRWLAYAGSLLAAGVVAVALVVDRTGTGGLAERRRVLVGAAVLALVGSVVAVWGSAAELAGGSLVEGLRGVPDLVDSGRPGAVLGLRVVAAAALLLAVAVPALLAGVPTLAVVAAAATLLLPSLGGHASTASPSVAAVAADALHLLAVAAWIGGLAVVVLTWVPDRERLRAFSSVALVAALATVATGSLGAWFQVGSPAGLTDTDYGRLLLAKVAGTAVLLVLGFVHRRWLAEAGRSVAAMVAGVRAEVLLGAAVLAVTSVLVATPPARDTLVEPVRRVGQAGETTVRLDVTPARGGPNDVHVYFLALDGSLAAVDAAELQVSTRGVAARVEPLTAVTPSHSVASGVQLTPGTWRFRLVVVRDGAPAEVTFTVPVR